MHVVRITAWILRSIQKKIMVDARRIGVSAKGRKNAPRHNYCLSRYMHEE